jgi:multiphosphoryl transfer protein
MTGIVVVSHSAALASAAVALAAEMLGDSPVRIQVAAGLEDGGFGTDAMAIVEALTAADDGQGVVVLMDLGSAVLSAGTALEFVDDDLRERVVLCPAPLVEGLVVAAVSASGGAAPAAVADEARNALRAKESHLGPRAVSSGVPVSSSGPVRSVRFSMRSPHGLHARPAAALVRLAAAADAEVELRNRTTGSEWVAATSLSRVATLGALRGHELEARATGADAERVLTDLKALAESDFGDAPAPRGGSPGIGIGPAHIVEGGVDLEHLPDDVIGDLDDALAVVRREIETARASVGAVGVGEIFDAHLALLDDPDLLDRAREAVAAGETPARAWAAATLAVAAAFDALPDPYLRARGADLRAVGGQVVQALLGRPRETSLPAGVVVADDLTPAQAAALDPGRVKGVVLAAGSSTSHSVILLRAHGIPAVVGAGVLTVAAGATVLLDGRTGEVVVDPGPTQLRDFQERGARERAATEAARAAAGDEARTHSGVRVLVGANVGSVAEAQAAAGADLIGLVRTEFLFLDRPRAPDVDEQAETYRRLAEAVEGKRVTIRTLDVGGDKPLPYLPQKPEANPFLGVRGLRLALRNPELLDDQLLAVVRVAHETPVSVMFPMVTTVAELLAARRALAAAIARDGRGEPRDLQVGIMVEVPAAALRAGTFAPHVDFLSIGTNDLTQYTLAAERGNAAVADLVDALDPAVLRLIGATVEGSAGKLVAVCGELAADERATATLIGLGVRELSVAPPAVAAVKQAVRATHERGPAC